MLGGTHDRCGSRTVGLPPRRECCFSPSKHGGLGVRVGVNFAAAIDAAAIFKVASPELHNLFYMRTTTGTNCSKVTERFRECLRQRTIAQHDSTGSSGIGVAIV